MRTMIVMGVTVVATIFCTQHLFRAEPIHREIVGAKIQDRAPLTPQQVIDAEWEVVDNSCAKVKSDMQMTFCTSNVMLPYGPIGTKH